MKGPSEITSAKRFLSESCALQGLIAFGAVFVLSTLLAPGATSKHAIVKSVLLQLILVLGLPVAFSSWLGLQRTTTLYLQGTSVRNLICCVVMTLSALILLDEVALWQEKLTGVSAALSPELESLLRADSLHSLTWIFLSLAVVPAACEEILFRGFILNRFISTGHPGQALTMTALLFGLFHRSLSTLLITSLAGLLLCLIVWRTGSVYNAMVVHCAVNGWAILVANTTLSDRLPWLDNAGHVPIPIQILCIAGALWAGKMLKPRQIEKQPQ